jgi:uncharacterized protein RhaS with RHS repeats
MFMQTDAIGLNGGVNLYGYVGGDPVDFVDPISDNYDPVSHEHVGETDGVSSPGLALGITRSNTKLSNVMCPGH